MKTKNRASRKFCHKEGFDDGTQYLECFANGETHAVMVNHEVKKGFEDYYTLEECEKFVDKGVWIEFQ